MVLERVCNVEVDRREGAVVREYEFPASAYGCDGAVKTSVYVVVARGNAGPDVHYADPVEHVGQY